MSDGVLVAIVSMVGAGLMAPLMVVVQERIKSNATVTAAAFTAQVAVSDKRQETQDAWYDRVLAQNTALESRLDTMEAKLERTEQELRDTKRRLEDKEEEAQRLRGRIDEITDQLQAAKTTNQMMTRKVAELEQRIRQHEATP